MKTIADIVCEQLAGTGELVLATIINRDGSTPRTAGTQMVVTRDARGHGTIGGGLLEAKVIEKSVEVLEDGDPCFLSFDLTSDHIAAMDMICGGSAEILLTPISPTPENLTLFDTWRRLTTTREEGFLLTAIYGGMNRIGKIERGLVGRNGAILGDLSLSIADLHALTLEKRQSSAMQVVAMGETTVIVEPSLKPKTALFFGAGHVAQPTASLAAGVGFRVVVLDDRPEFANGERFPEAHSVRVLADFDGAFEGLEVDEDAFIVILTRGHLHDKTVLAGALKTEARYIGMIGSRRKRDQIFGLLLKEGFTHEDLKRVFCPIGIDIQAETPEEIAVSIVAELIQERARENR
ncbi:MAG: XdhC family aldehyde oxidoreductase maturation factor [Desulfobacterales bacterium]